jgi:hypothetical protein
MANHLYRQALEMCQGQGDEEMDND